MISTKKMEIIVASILMALGALVMWDSNRIGSGWGSDGPESGAFPFYIGLIIILSCVMILIDAVRAADDSEGFVEPEQFKLVMAVLIPSLIYVVASFYIGIYVASAVFIAVFMAWQGKFGPGKYLSVGISVPVFLFFMFEIWFKVPLPKGPLEAALGF